MWGWEWEERRAETGERYTPDRWEQQMKVLAACLLAKSGNNTLTEARSKLNINSIDFSRT